MTTIVYDHKNKKLACDSRMLKRYKLSSDSYKKWRQIGDDYYFFCGTVADIEQFLNHPKEFGVKPSANIDVGVYRVSDGTVYECDIDDDTGYFEVELTFNAATGSGGDFALAALDFGCSAYEAIKYASTKDVGTGGDIVVLEVGTGKIQTYGQDL